MSFFAIEGHCKSEFDRIFQKPPRKEYVDFCGCKIAVEVCDSLPSDTIMLVSPMEEATCFEDLIENNRVVVVKGIRP